MIPVLILFGLVFGRWWRLSLIAAAVGWPALLVATDVTDAEPRLFVAAGFAVANTAVGVSVHQVVLRTIRRSRSRPKWS